MDESVIDRAVYAELRDTTGAKFVAELVDTFIEEGPGMLAELRAARAEGNAERFRRAVHSLKSNGRAFGAVKLTALAREFELKGLDADPTRDVAGLAALGFFVQLPLALPPLASGVLLLFLVGYSTPIGQLIPLRRRAFMPREDVVAAFASAPVLAADRFRADIDTAIDQDLPDRGW